MTEICFYFKLIENTDFIKCNLCNDEIDLNKSFALLETHMKAKHKEKQWDKERFIIGNSGAKN
jgi:hypothetical protein